MWAISRLGVLTLPVLVSPLPDLVERSLIAAALWAAIAALVIWVRQQATYLSKLRSGEVQ